MAKIHEVKKIDNVGVEYTFMCPACGVCHSVDLDGYPKYVFNKNMDQPSFWPAIMVRTGPENNPNICHFLIDIGLIKFLSDCTHELKNKTIKLEDF